MSDTVSYDDRMSEADALMWHIERDPLLRSTVTSVWVLDCPPDADRFDDTIERAVEAIPRLRQRVVPDRMGLAPPRWEADPHFDRAYHIRRLKLAGEGSLRDLFDLAAPIAAQAFDKDRPLWEFYLVDGMGGGRSGVLMKLHHSVSDGMGLVRMTEHMVERGREPRPDRIAPAAPRFEQEPRTEWQHVQDAVRHRAKHNASQAGRVARALGQGVGDLVRDPTSTLRSARATVESLARMLKPVSEPMSPLLTERSLTVRFDGLTVPVDELKRAARSVDGTINDAFVAIVCGALRLYHEQLGRPVAKLRMNMPINLRSGEDARRAGNQFAPARFEVPIEVADPRKRMKAIQRLVRSQRDEPALGLAGDVNAAIGRLGITASTAVVGSMMKALDFVTSNVPGPRHPVYASGAKIEHMFPFGPLAGAAINVTLFSYAGDCQIGVNLDPAAVSEPERLMDCMRKGVEEVISGS
jgi:WS/DGAT/MGAT family acyltransferase